MSTSKATVPLSSEANQQEYLQVASDLGEKIWEQRAVATDGSLTWRHPKPVPPDGAVRWTVPLPDVYTGASGIGIFFAALARVTGSPVARKRALSAVEPLRRYVTALASDEERLKKLQFTVGGLAGGSSFCYGLWKIGELLGAPEVLDDALVASTLVSPERIASDRNHDLAGGCAGAILALLGLHRHRPQPNPAGYTALELATLCGAHLLASRTSRDNRPRAWPWPGAPSQPLLTGLAHGAAGISLALFRLYWAVGDTEFEKAALEGLEFEREHYSPSKKNWLDLRFAFPHYMKTWCHGAPGIALGRLALLPKSNDEKVRTEIRMGLETTLASETMGIDHACCGDMGHVDILIEASLRLGHPEYYKAAEDRARFTLERRRTEGEFIFLPNREPPWFSSSFFKGASGIGYTLLRLVDPKSLSSVLLVE